MSELDPAFNHAAEECLPNGEYSLPHQRSIGASRSEPHSRRWPCGDVVPTRQVEGGSEDVSASVSSSHQANRSRKGTPTMKRLLGPTLVATAWISVATALAAEPERIRGTVSAVLANT